MPSEFDAFVRGPSVDPKYRTPDKPKLSDPEERMWDIHRRSVGATTSVEHAARTSVNPTILTPESVSNTFLEIDGTRIPLSRLLRGYCDLLDGNLDYVNTIRNMTGLPDAACEKILADGRLLMAPYVSGSFNDRE